MQVHPHQNECCDTFNTTLTGMLCIILPYPLILVKWIYISLYTTDGLYYIVCVRVRVCICVGIEDQISTTQNRVSLLGTQSNLSTERCTNRNVSLRWVHRRVLYQKIYRLGSIFFCSGHTAGDPVYCSGITPACTHMLIGKFIAGCCDYDVNLYSGIVVCLATFAFYVRISV